MKYKKNLITLTLFIGLIVFILPITADAAQTFESGKTLPATVAGTAGLGTTGSLAGTIGSAIGAALAFVGSLFIILVIYGGILWMTAGGKDEQVTKGRKYIINATIGLVIVVLAYVITAFVMTALQTQGTPSNTSGVSSGNNSYYDSDNNTASSGNNS